jgi:hypothetical protein
MKHIAIGLALALAVPLASCQTYAAGQQAQSASSAAQWQVKGLITATIAYTVAVDTIARLVQADVLKGATLTKVLAVREKALDAGDAVTAVAAVGELNLLIGAQ